jgi:hypothetical protein
MIVLGTCNPSPVCCNRLLLIIIKNYLTLFEYLMNLDIQMPLAFHTPMRMVV